MLYYRLRNAIQETESAKAVKLDVGCSIKKQGQVTEYSTRSVWVPKSMVTFKDGYFELADWMIVKLEEQIAGETGGIVGIEVFENGE